jgi:hypothetical protein
VGIILCALSVFASMSRNGVMAMIVASAITGSRSVNAAH